MSDYYGNCPLCGAPGVTRERRLGGNDRCERGHTYPSAKAMDGECRRQTWGAALSLAEVVDPRALSVVRAADKAARDECMRVTRVTLGSAYRLRKPCTVDLGAGPVVFTWGPGVYCIGIEAERE